MIVIDNLKDLKKYKNTTEEILVEETHTVYKWNGNDWNIQKNTEIPLGSVYDLNKGIFATLPKISDEALQAGKDLIAEYVEKNESCNYYMLLNNDRKDYTLFHINHNLFDYPRIFNEVIECLENRGTIKQIDWADDNKGAVEFWISANNEAYVYYLFNYQEGVLEVK